MLSVWNYIGYYFGLLILTIMLMVFIYLGIHTLKKIWNNKLFEFFYDLLKEDKRSFFFVYGLVGIGIYKILNIFLPHSWSKKTLTVIYCFFLIMLLLIGVLGLYLLVTDFYFSPMTVIHEINKEFK
ncbi:hypothetical protein [Fictibacillus barbaricus]|uniref:Uncharacterized protein n=1 Tax=Fictibacillus barbaricus TaxID=182136 RepID=A0ABU1U0R3_9BACL|nr:hypothetical protein [Fictibacillus barbaricus]MDR7073076.1 hypothetical protein [Fictibacillus barbaricus]